MHFLLFLPFFWQTLNSFCLLSLSLPLKETKTFFFSYFLFMTKLPETKCIALAIHCSQIVLFTPGLLSSVVGSITCNARRCFKTLFIVSGEGKERRRVEIVSVTHMGNGYEMNGRKEESTRESEELVTYAVTQSHSHVWHNNWSSLTLCDNVRREFLACCQMYDFYVCQRLLYCP